MADPAAESLNHNNQREKDSRSLFRQAVDWVFGYDFFISYCWADGREYALALERKLEAQGFNCFLDSSDYAKGDDWRQQGRRALKKTSRLILIGSPAALGSEPVQNELRIFTGEGKRIFAIDFDGALDPHGRSDGIFRYLPPDLLRVPEAAGALRLGPTEEIVQDIRNSFDLVRQDRKRVRVFAGAAAIFAAVAVLSVILWFTARAEERRANTEADRAIRAQKETAKTFSLSDLYRADDLYGEGERAEALAHLARALRSDPSNTAAGRRAAYMMGEGGYFSESGVAEGTGSGPERSPGTRGRLLREGKGDKFAVVQEPWRIVASTNGVHVFETGEDGGLRGSPTKEFPPVEREIYSAAALSPDQRVLAAGGGLTSEYGNSGRFQVIMPSSEREPADWFHWVSLNFPHPVDRLLFSGDSSYLGARAGGRLWIYRIRREFPEEVRLVWKEDLENIAPGAVDSFPETFSLEDLALTEIGPTLGFEPVPDPRELVADDPAERISVEPNASTVRVEDTLTGDDLGEFKISGPTVLAVDADFSRLLTLRADCRLEIRPIGDQSGQNPVAGVDELRASPHNVLLLREGRATAWQIVWASFNRWQIARVFDNEIAPWNCEYAAQPGNQSYLEGRGAKSTSSMTLRRASDNAVLWKLEDIPNQEIDVAFGLGGAIALGSSSHGGAAIGKLYLIDAKTGLLLDHPRKAGGDLLVRPDGRRVFSMTEHGVFAFDLLGDEGPVPEWFVELIEAVSGRRLNDRNQTEWIPGEKRLAEIERLRVQVAALSEDDSGWAAFGHWFLLSGPDPKLSPYATMTWNRLRELKHKSRTGEATTPDPVPDERRKDRAEEHRDSVETTNANATNEAEKLRALVDSYLRHSSGRESVEALLSLFADRVEYHGNTGFTTADIREDIEVYNAEWPRREFWREGAVEILPAGGRDSSRIVRFEMAFRKARSGAEFGKTVRLSMEMEVRMTEGRIWQIVRVGKQAERFR